MKHIDLRSDTVTEPTTLMRQAMYDAEVGDDVYGDDPTMRQLEESAARLVNKEAALFVPSGTFGNQLALFTHCPRGSEVILGEDCHIVQHEVGAPAVIAGVQLRTLRTDKGALNPDEVQACIRPEDLQFPETSLICLENTHSNGRVISLENMQEIYTLAHKNQLPVHLDGARLFNAATYLKADASSITRYCDSVMFCLSKGLCAPVGSILAGDADFIRKARKKRKLMGGGLRQSGILAAAGLIALKEMRLRLEEDHQTANLLGQELSKIPGIKVYLDNIHINMVFFDIQASACTDDRMVRELLRKGIKINPAENGVMRFVTHHGISIEDIHYVVSAVRECINTTPQ